MEQLDWGLDIHDAVICNPEDGFKVRELYAELLEQVYRDRQTILNEYFKSVGVLATPKVKAEWEELRKMVTPIEEDFKCSLWAMK